LGFGSTKQEASVPGVGGDEAEGGQTFDYTELSSDGNKIEGLSQRSERILLAFSKNHSGFIEGRSQSQETKFLPQPR
jgi:hypothetical protein